MDGLLPAPRWASTPLRIPFLNTFEYTFSHDDSTSMRGIHRTGYGSATHIFDNDTINDLPFEDRASCLQAWLFFGLLSRFFQRQITPSDIIRDFHDEQAPSLFVDPIKMHALVEAWAEGLRGKNQKTRQNEIDKATVILDFAAEQSEIFDTCQLRRKELEKEPAAYTLAAVIFSIKLLISYLRSTVEVFRALLKSTPQEWLSGILHLRRNMSTRMMNQVLFSIRSAVGEGDRSKLLLPIPPGGKNTLSTHLLLNRFCSNGWCLVRAKQLCGIYDYSVVNYLSQVRRSDPPGIRHLRCEMASSCIAYNLPDETTYKPRHTLPNCTCQTRINMTKNVTEIIQRGGIPILSMNPQAEDLDLRVHRSNGVIPYIAISHVWSDGLGNPNENSLPFCQLQKLASILWTMKEQRNMKTTRLRRYFSPQYYFLYHQRVFFWMDTLCIPVDGDEKMHEMKTAALKHITPIFQDAESVLVLDSELQSLQLGDLAGRTEEQISRDQEELTARIIGSKWIQRAWTLEEGALARDCHFLVAQKQTMLLGHLVPPELQPRKERNKNNTPWRRETITRSNASDVELGLLPGSNAMYDPKFDVPLKLLLAGPLNEKRKQAARQDTGKKELEIFMESRTSQLVEAWNNLLERSATKEEDPVVIFANILDFNAALIRKINPIEDRLPTVVKSCRELPVSLLFNTQETSLRNGHPKDAWLPRRIGGNRLVNSAVIRKNKENEFSGIRLSIDRKPCKSDSFVVLRRPNKVPFEELTFCLKIEGTSSEEVYVIEVLPEWKSWSPQYLPASYLRECQEAYDEAEGGTCIMIDKSTGSESINGYTGRGAQFGLLVGQSSAHDREIFLRYRAPIIAWSRKQWLHSGRSPDVWQTVTAWTTVREKESLFLDYDESNWVNLRKQRTLLPPASASPVLKLMLLAVIIGEGVGSGIGVNSKVSNGSNDSKGSNGSNYSNYSNNSNNSNNSNPGAAIGCAIAIVIATGVLFRWILMLERVLVYRRWVKSFYTEWDDIVR